MTALVARNGNYDLAKDKSIPFARIFLSQPDPVTNSISVLGQGYTDEHGYFGIVVPELPPAVAVSVTKDSPENPPIVKVSTTASGKVVVPQIPAAQPDPITSTSIKLDNSTDAVIIKGNCDGNMTVLLLADGIPVANTTCDPSGKYVVQMRRGESPKKGKLSLSVVQKDQTGLESEATIVGWVNCNRRYTDAAN